MTFYEAAIAVLREAGRGLHYKKITEHAIRQGLLTHVGRTPEVTMQSRLKQEIRKGSEALLREARPGVFELRKDADLNDALETQQLRNVQEEPEEEELDPELEPIDEDTDDTSSEAPAPTDESNEDASSDDDEDSDRGGRRRRRRRGRRGGRTRDQDDSGSDDEEDNEEDASPAEPERSAPAKAPEPRRKEQARPREQAPRADTGQATEPVPVAAQAKDLDLEDAGDFARVLVEIFRSEKAVDLTQRQIAGALSRRRFGGVARLSPTRVRAALEDANRRRSTSGWPPLFVEVKPERWALAEASGKELARSYGSLQQWQTEHRDILRRTLTQRLQRLDGDALSTMVTLLLEKLGYRNITQHERAGSEYTTLSASLEHGITRSRIAVRIMPPGHALTRLDVQHFRGSLHLYGADDAAILATAGFADGAASEAEIPNLATISLLESMAFSRHLIRNGIGVASFTVDVSCIDETFFRDFDEAE